MVGVRTKILLAVMALSVGVAQAVIATGAGKAVDEDKRTEQAFATKFQSDQERAQDQSVTRNQTALLNDPNTPVIGDPNTDVASVEFFDYACPYCKALEPRLEAFLKTDNRVKLVVKEFPILTPESLVAAKASLASMKQQKCQQFHQALMLFKGRLQDSAIFETAKDAGLDLDRLRKDVQSPEIGDEIIANFNLARAIRVSQTPAIIVANHVLTEPSAEIDFPKVVAAARQK